MVDISILELKLMVIPFVSAFIGWLTNFIAIKSLFHPRCPTKIFLITFHGLIPKRKNNLAKEISEAVDKHLLSREDIEKILFDESLKRNLEKQIFNVMKEKVCEHSPRIFSAMIDPIFYNIERKNRGKIIKFIEENFLESVLENTNTREIIEEKIKSFDVIRLETMIKDIAKRELRYIEILGGVIGFLVGFVQIGILQVI